MRPSNAIGDVCRQSDIGFLSDRLISNRLADCVMYAVQLEFDSKHSSVQGRPSINALKAVDAGLPNKFVPNQNLEMRPQNGSRDIQLLLQLFKRCGPLGENIGDRVKQFYSGRWTNWLLLA